MKNTILGSGYVGLVTGTCQADSGNDLYESAELSQLGFAYYGIGRKAAFVASAAEGRGDGSAKIGNYRRT